MLQVSVIFQFFLHHFVLAKLATSSIRVKGQDILLTVVHEGICLFLIICKMKYKTKHHNIVLF